MFNTVQLVWHNQSNQISVGLYAFRSGRWRKGSEGYRYWADIFNTMQLVWANTSNQTNVGCMPLTRKQTLQVAHYYLTAASVTGRVIMA